jgi:hypothetical protein
MFFRLLPSPAIPIDSNLKPLAYPKVKLWTCLLSDECATSEQTVLRTVAALSQEIKLTMVLRTLLSTLGLY